MSEFVSGRFRVRIIGRSTVVLTREGMIGRGPSMASRMWTVEQVEAALLSARSRRGKEALDEARALAWALAEVRAVAESRKRDADPLLPFLS